MTICPVDGQIDLIFLNSGPLAASVLSRAAGTSLDQVNFTEARHLSVGSISIYATRCGYTGEDGFELIIPSAAAEKVVNLLLTFPEVQLCGLGARDSLRLEAGLCLSGTDIHEEYTPVEAGLTWLIGKEARKRADFPGANVILHQLSHGASRYRVGLSIDGPPARHGTKVLDENGVVIGEITSGGPSPSLNRNIALGYVKAGHHKAGTTTKVEVRGSKYPALVTKLPFVPAKYYRVLDETQKRAASV